MMYVIDTLILLSDFMHDGSCKEIKIMKMPIFFLSIDHNVWATSPHSWGEIKLDFSLQGEKQTTETGCLIL